MLSTYEIIEKLDAECGKIDSDIEAGSITLEAALLNNVGLVGKDYVIDHLCVIYPEQVKALLGNTKKVEELKAKLSELPKTNENDVVYQATILGFDDLVQQYRLAGASDTVMRYALKYGRDEIFKLYREFSTVPERLKELVLDYGSVSIVEQFAQDGNVTFKEVVEFAVKNHRFDLIDWCLKKNCAECDGYTLISHAILNYDSKLVNWFFVEKGIEYITKIASAAIAASNVEVLTLCFEHYGYTFDLPSMLEKAKGECEEYIKNWDARKKHINEIMKAEKLEEESIKTLVELHKTDGVHELVLAAIRSLQPADVMIISGIRQERIISFLNQHYTHYYGLLFGVPRMESIERELAILAKTNKKAAAFIGMVMRDNDLMLEYTDETNVQSLAEYCASSNNTYGLEACIKAYPDKVNIPQVLILSKTNVIEWCFKNIEYINIQQVLYAAVEAKDLNLVKLCFRDFSNEIDEQKFANLSAQYPGQVLEWCLINHLDKVIVSDLKRFAKGEAVAYIDLWLEVDATLRSDDKQKTDEMLKERDPVIVMISAINLGNVSVISTLMQSPDKAEKLKGMDTVIAMKNAVKALHKQNLLQHDVSCSNVDLATYIAAIIGLEDLVGQYVNEANFVKVKEYAEKHQKHNVLKVVTDWEKKLENQIKIIIKSKKIETLRISQLVKDSGDEGVYQLLLAAIQADDESVVNYLKESQSDVLSSVIKSQNMNIRNEITKRGEPSHAASIAAILGFEDLAQVRTNEKNVQSVAECAAAHNRQGVLKHCIDQYKGKLEIAKVAVKSVDIDDKQIQELVAELVTNGKTLELILAAIENGKVLLLAHMVKQHHGVVQNIMLVSGDEIKKKIVEVAPNKEWAHAAAAALFGFQDLVEQYTNKGNAQKVAKYAAKSGRLNILAGVLDKFWDEIIDKVSLIQDAVGNPEIIEYIRIKHIVSSKNLETRSINELVKESGAKGVYALMIASIHNGGPDPILWLQQKHGAVLVEVCREKQGELEAAVKKSSKGRIWAHAAVAAILGFTDLVREYVNEGNAKKVSEYAVKSGNLGALKVCFERHAGALKIYELQGLAKGMPHIVAYFDELQQQKELEDKVRAIVKSEPRTFDADNFLDAGLGLSLLINLIVEKGHLGWLTYLVHYHSEKVNPILQASAETLKQKLETLSKTDKETAAYLSALLGFNESVEKYVDKDNLRHVEYYASSAGRLEVVKWLVQNQKDASIQNIMLECRIETVKWLLEEKRIDVSTAALKASELKDIEFLHKCILLDPKRDISKLISSASPESLEFLKAWQTRSRLKVGVFVMPVVGCIASGALGFLSTNFILPAVATTITAETILVVWRYFDSKNFDRNYPAPIMDESVSK